MDFIINKAIHPEDNPHCTFRLHVVGMSGDGDHYETNTREFDNVDQMLPTFRMMIRGFQTASFYDDKALELAIEMEGERIDIGNPNYKPYAQDIYSDLVGYDVTCEGRKCMPDRMYITWFNDFGTEYKISIVSDGGEVVEEITEYNADKF
jgi:hypothetical protein